jgi:hypothetical protein
MEIKAKSIAELTVHMVYTIVIFIQKSRKVCVVIFGWFWHIFQGGHTSFNA